MQNQSEHSAENAQLRDEVERLRRENVTLKRLVVELRADLASAQSRGNSAPRRERTWCDAADYMPPTHAPEPWAPSRAPKLATFFK